MNINTSSFSKLVFLIIALTGVTIAGHAQVDTSKVYEFVSVMPEYPGGESVLKQDIAINFIYPREALKSNVSGMLMIRFIVELDGSISNIEVIRSLGHGLDEAGINAVKKLKKFETPAKFNGESVRTYYSIPIRCVPKG